MFDFTFFGLYFLDPLTPTMYGILSVFGLFTQYLIFIQIFVTFYLFYVLFFCGSSFLKYNFYLLNIFFNNKNVVSKLYRENIFEYFVNLFFFKFKNYFYFRLNLSNIVHNEFVESIWTFFPAIILLILAIPTFTLLYASDEVISNPNFLVNVVGNQWYWSYKISFPSLFFNKPLNYVFDCYLTSNLNYKRLLETTEKLFVSATAQNMFLITGSDVIHSWTVPSLGFKVDAIPGRLSAAMIFVDSLGNFYGQCSEICGAQHGFMPIQLSIIPKIIANFLYDLKFFTLSTFSYDFFFFEIDFLLDLNNDCLFIYSENNIIYCSNYINNDFYILV